MSPMRRSAGMCGGSSGVLGVQLFRNVTRGVELTAAGQQYLQEVSPALDRIAEATDALDTSCGGIVALSVEPTFALRWLMPRLGHFQERHPDIEVQLDASYALADLKTYERDIAIRYSARRVSDPLTYDLICDAPVYPYGATHLDEIERPADILRYRLLHADKGGLWRRWLSEMGLDEIKLPRVTAPLSTLLVIQGAIAGQGVILMSEELVIDDVRAGRLKRLSNVPLAYGAYHLVYLKEKLRQAPIGLFRAWLLDASSELRA